MKWFKHASDNHRGQSMQFIMDELGHFGVAGIYILKEICAEKLNKKTTGELTEDDCTFTLHRRVVESALRVKLSAVERLLSVGSSCNLLSYKIDGNFIEIKMPILLDLLDYDSKKSRTRRAHVVKGSRLEIEIDKEIEIEIDKDKYLCAEAEIETLGFSNAFAKSANEKKLTKKQCDAWLQAYSDASWIETEFLKSIAWCEANKNKAPKKFSRFFDGWLSRGWENHRKNIPSAKTFLSKAEQREQANKKAMEEALKFYDGK